VKQSPPGRGVGGGVAPIVESRCVAAYNEDVEDLLRAIVNCKVCEFVKRLYLLVVTSCKNPK
jgi:hypothetical protein